MMRRAFHAFIEAFAPHRMSDTRLDTPGATADPGIPAGPVYATVRRSSRIKARFRLGALAEALLSKETEGPWQREIAVFGSEGSGPIPMESIAGTEHASLEDIASSTEALLRGSLSCDPTRRATAAWVCIEASTANGTKVFPTKRLYVGRVTQHGYVRRELHGSEFEVFGVTLDDELGGRHSLYGRQLGEACLQEQVLLGNRVEILDCGRQPLPDLNGQQRYQNVYAVRNLQPPSGDHDEN